MDMVLDERRSIEGPRDGWSKDEFTADTNLAELES